MTASELSQWSYLIYVLPGGLAVLFLLLSAAGGGRHHGGGHHGAGLGHHGAGAASHAGSHSLAHSGHPVHGAHMVHSHHHQSNANGRQGSQPRGFDTLGFFGIGSLPPTFVWGSCLVGWGFFGFFATRWLQAALHTPAAFVLPSAAIAGLGAAMTMRLAAMLGSRFMPKDETAVTSTIDLCGFTGTVAYPVDQLHGRVHVYDAFGTMHDVEARIGSGQDAITRGSKVLVVDYDAAGDRVIVEQAP